MYNSSNRITMIRVDLIYHKLLNLVRGLAIVFWFWTLIENINADEFIREHFSNILEQQFTIGKYHVSPGSILIFFLVLYLSFYLSGLLDGLFYDEKRTSESSTKTSLGSIVLMLRLFVLSAGFVIGVIVAGIPLDSVGLFFGALGVGIGFGLQGLIANLISGIIIAFEKPVYVGDIIQVEGERGRVTDIGLRATKVDTADGAEHIIPNATLINQMMTNWTLTSKYFRIESVIEVDLNNDAGMIISLLEERIKDIPAILKVPPPIARLSEISSGSLHFTISCWVSDIMRAGTAKNEVLQQIHRSFDEANIRYPKRHSKGDSAE
jgi:small-conductance mechanosensitive channel